MHRDDDLCAHGALHAAAARALRRAAHHWQRRSGRAHRSRAFAELGGAYLAIIGGTAALETTWVEAIEDVDLDDLHPESLWRFRVRGFGPLRVAMDSHGASIYAAVNAGARARRAAALAALGVKSR